MEPISSDTQTSPSPHKCSCRFRNCERVPRDLHASDNWRQVVFCCSSRWRAFQPRLSNRWSGWAVVQEGICWHCLDHQTNDCDDRWSAESWHMKFTKYSTFPFFRRQKIVQLCSERPSHTKYLPLPPHTYHHAHLDRCCGLLTMNCTNRNKSTQTGNGET